MEDVLNVYERVYDPRRPVIGFDEKTDKDGLAEIKGIYVIYSKGEVFFFAGMKIDFAEQDGRKGIPHAHLGLPAAGMVSCEYRYP